MGGVRVGRQTHRRGRRPCGIDGADHNPHKPLLPKGDTELADAIYQAVTAKKIVLVDGAGIPYKVHTPGDVNLADSGIRLQRPAPPQDSPDPDDGGVSAEASPTEPGVGKWSTGSSTDTMSPPAPDEPASAEPDTAPGGQHWMANITINTDIDATEGNDPLVQLLREVMHAVDAGAITHINQMSSVTITADQQTADKLQAAADQAGAQINIRPL